MDDLISQLEAATADSDELLQAVLDTDPLNIADALRGAAYGVL